MIFSKYWLGRALSPLGRYDEAIPLLREAGAYWTSRAASAAQDPSAAYDAANGQAILGVALVGAGQLDEAEPLLTKNMVFIEQSDPHILETSQV